MTEKERTPVHHDGGRMKADDQMKERQRAAAAAAEAAEKDRPHTGSLAAERNRKATRYARTTLREISSQPAFRSGMHLTADELSQLVDDYVADADIPRNLQAKVKTMALEVAELHAGGNHLAADNRARELAIGLGNELARSSWDPNKGDDFDPREVASRIAR